MSEDPAGWLHRLAGSLTVDPGMPPGIAVMRSALDQVITVSDSARHAGGLAVSDQVAEEYRSLGESEPFIVHHAEQGPGIARECCGTPVALMPERERSQGQPWKPGIWECEVLRKHTMRRCEWKRANP